MRGAAWSFSHVSALPAMMWRWPSMNPGIRVMPRPSIRRAPAGAAASAPTEAIRPPRTTTVPDSITEPLPTMMRAFEMTTSWPAAAAGIPKTAHASHAHAQSCFMARGYAFRFCFVYFALWCAATQVLGGIALTPFGALPALGPLWPMRAITEWTALHLFGVAATFQPGNSGDTVFYWVQTFWIVCVALIAAAVWSYVGRVRLKPDPTRVAAAFNRRDP